MATKKTKTTPVPVEDSLMTEDDFEEIRHPPVILLYGEITDELVAEASNVIISAHYIKRRPEKITILLNSEGGLLHSAFSLIEVITSSKIPIEITALGQCVSAGVLIFMSGTKGMRFITPTCTVMSHSFSTEIQGNHFDLQSVQKELEYTHARMVNHYITHTNQTKVTIETHLIGTQDRWLTPQDVVKFGIADEVRRIELPN